MNGGELNREQLESIKERLGPTLAYLHRLRTRMEQTGFVPSDRLYESVAKTADAM